MAHDLSIFLNCFKLASSQYSSYGTQRHTETHGEKLTYRETHGEKLTYRDTW